MKRVWVVSLLSAVFVTSAQAGTIRHDVSDDVYRSAGELSAFDAVGRIQGNMGSQGFSASGTLISPHWVLTAAHVVDGASSINFTVNGQTRSATAWGAHPGWPSNVLGLLQGVDVGLMYFDQPITDVSPIARHRAGTEFGKEAAIVGFGQTGTGITGATAFDAQKRAGVNIIDKALSPRVLLTDFDDPRLTAAHALEYQPAPGDSGGALLIIDPTQGLSLAGVISFVADTSGGGLIPIDGIISNYRDHAGYVRVAAINDWVDQVLQNFNPAEVLAAGDGSRLVSELPWQPIFAAVPEPATLTMFVALAGAVLTRRRG